MPFVADLHIHSKYSRATSSDCDLEHLTYWARRKGITVVGTGDFTHPVWFAELREKLVPAEPGLFRLRDDVERAVEDRLAPSCGGTVRFLLSVEISTIYKKGDATRKIHHLVYAPDFESADRIRTRLARVGNIASDGRPILGLDSRNLLEITLEGGEGTYLVPAHIWTPWFAVLGSKSGFDSVAECYGDLAPHIFAVETGLSSDPPMNWRVSSLDRYRLVSNSDAHSPPVLGREACTFDTPLDYFALRRALETGQGYGGTVEFFPEEGKYHLDGHRKCEVRLEPEETKRLGGLCPVCNKPLTVGVMHRVDALADRPDGARPSGATPFRNLVPLAEIVGEILGVGPKSKAVSFEVERLVADLGPELAILDRVPIEAVRRASSELVAEAIARLRRGEVRREAGYDGEYGKIHLFSPSELQRPAAVANLFEIPEPPRAAPPARERALFPQPEPISTEPEGTPTGGARVEAPVPLARPATVLDALDPDQRAAAAVAQGPVLILAGPGTGKTRTLTHRLAHLVAERGVAPERCLAITFTRRAADEMRERLEVLLPDRASRVLVSTFHGLGLRIVEEQRAALGLHRGLTVLGEEEQVALARELFGGSERETRRVLARIASHKRAMVLEPAAEGAPDEETVRASARYTEALFARDAVDFDDLLVLPVKLLAADPAIAAHYRARFLHVLIDEYQDIDPLQYRLVRLLSTADGNVCAIGDPDQAIYGFRGADVGFFLRFQEDFPGAQVVPLTRNYRSSRVIVGGALQVIAPSTFVPGRVLEAVRGAEADPKIVIHEAADERAEAELVARAIERLVGGASYYAIDSGRVDGTESPNVSFADVAVLYRSDALAAPLTEALTRTGIPFQKRSHERLLDSPAARLLAEALRAEGGPGGEPIRARLTRLATALGVEALAALDWLAPLADACGTDADRFLTELALGAEIDTWDPRAERVSLLTLHASKGLEFPVVFIVGCEDGILPLRFGEASEAEIAEERRLFFVGVTRARERLTLTHARTRAWRGPSQPRSRSAFLDALEEGLLDLQRGLAPKPRGPRTEQLRLF